MTIRLIESPRFTRRSRNMRRAVVRPSMSLSRGVWPVTLWLSLLSRNFHWSQRLSKHPGLRAFRENDWVDDIGEGLTTITVVVRHPVLYPSELRGEADNEVHALSLPAFIRGCPHQSGVSRIVIRLNLLHRVVNRSFASIPRPSSHPVRAQSRVVPSAPHGRGRSHAPPG